MKNKACLITVIFFSFLFVSCYGSWNIFYEGNNVDNRAGSLLEIKDSSDPSFAASGISSLSGSYNVLIITDAHFGYKAKDAPVQALYLWLESVKNTAEAPEFCICLGDAVDTGAQEEYNEYITFCNTLQNLYGIKMIFNSCGNHDIYQSHWGNWQSNCYPHTSFYKFETSSFSWYSLDTASGTISRQQYDLFIKAISSDPKAKIVFSHYPLTEYNLAFGMGETTERNLLIHNLLKNNVKCYMGGHNHYSHFTNLGFYDYCCPSFRFNENWALLHINESNGSAYVSFFK